MKYRICNNNKYDLDLAREFNNDYKFPIDEISVMPYEKFRSIFDIEISILRFKYFESSWFPVERVILYKRLKNINYVVLKSNMHLTKDKDNVKY